MEYPTSAREEDIIFLLNVSLNYEWKIIPEEFKQLTKIIYDLAKESEPHNEFLNDTILLIIYEKNLPDKYCSRLQRNFKEIKAYELPDEF